MTLTNPTQHYVVWKAYSESTASIKVDNPDESTTNPFVLLDSSLKSNYSVFWIVPRSGSIPSMQKEVIRVEFSPRVTCGVFKQSWCIDTRVDTSRAASSVDSAAFQCKLMLNGRAVISTIPNMVVKPEDEGFSRNTNRVLNNSAINTSNSSSTTSTIVYLRNETLQFNDTPPNESSTDFLVVNNRSETNEYRVCLLAGFQAPFVCKKVGVEYVIKPKHYFKIPIEFKPRVTRRYEDKVVVRVEPGGSLLSCKLVANCCPKAIDI